MVRKVNVFTDSHSGLVFMLLPTDDPKQLLSGITLAREQLGWELAVMLEDGLKPTIACFEQLPSA